MPVIGFLNSGSPDAIAHLMRGFRQSLAEAGYVEGATSRSNIAGPKVNTIVCRRWPRSWFAAKWL